MEQCFEGIDAMMVRVKANRAREQRRRGGTRERGGWCYPQRGLGAPGGSPEGPRAVGAPRTERPAVDNSVRGFLPAQRCARLPRGDVELALSS